MLEGPGALGVRVLGRVWAPVLRVEARSLAEADRRAQMPANSSQAWRAECVRDFGLHTEGLYRLWRPGRGEPGEAAGVILKRLRAKGNEPPTEVAAYASGVLSSLPQGVLAPRYLGHGRSPEGGWDLWIQDVGRAMRRARWTTSTYAQAARGLGRLNAAWFLARPTQAVGWGQEGFLVAHARRWLATERWERRLRAGSPLLRRIRLALRELDALVAIAEVIPAALSHQDASPRNLLVASQPISGCVTLIDWELCGTAPLGQEIVPLVWSGWRGAAADELVAREALVWQGYLEGLASGGLELSSELVEGLRLAYSFGVAALYLPGIAASGEADVVALTVERLERAVALVRD